MEDCGMVLHFLSYIKECIPKMKNIFYFTSNKNK